MASASLKKMKPNNTTENHFTVCKGCEGQGKVAGKISKKKRRKKQNQDLKTKTQNSMWITKPVNKNLDVCVVCAGSGLVGSGCATTVNSNHPHVAIVGGGIGGTALAVACLHRGIPFTLYERDSDFDARSQGYGLTLQQASKAIAGFGIFELEGGIISTRHVVHDPAGKIIGEWGLRKWKGVADEKNSKRKNIHIPRQSLRLALLDNLTKVESLKWNHKLLDFSENPNGTFCLHFNVAGKTKTDQVDIIVGADGIRSVVRQQLIGEQKTPLQYLGCIVILGICPLKSIRNSNSSLLDSKTVFQTVNGHDRIYMMPFDDKTIMWQLSFPLSEEEAKNLSKKGPKSLKAESLRRLQGWHEPVFDILQATHESDITGYPVYDRKIFDPSVLHTKGNVTLIGDAAHPMSPFKGQGANQALLDALNLARRISKTYSQKPNLPIENIRADILNAFEQNMMGRTASKVYDSARAVELLHSDAVMHNGKKPRGRGF